MIYVPRPPASPEYLSRAEEEFEILRNLVEDQNVRPTMALATRRWVCHDSDTQQQLAEIFHGKCAFCDALLKGLDPINIEQFRPKSGAIRRVGEFDSHHYWWLSLEWRNLYPICAECNRAKGARFPIAGQPAPLRTPYEELFSESPLLLDPCLDNPEEFFVYDEEGTIASTQERGRVTIETFGLNRLHLVEMRKRVLAQLRHACERNAMVAAMQQRALRTPNPVADDLVQYLFNSSDQPYLGILRFFRARFEEEARQKANMSVFVEGIPAPKDNAPSKSAKPKKARAKFGIQGYTKAAVQKQVRQFKKEQENVDGYSLSETPDDRYFAKARYIARVRIRNFKAIEDLEIEFRESDSAKASCLMMVGENGTGKSTILQAIALTLLGEEDRNALELDPRDFVRDGQEEGSVEVTFADALSTPATLKFSKSKPSFTVENSSRVILLGYGSTRLLPRKDTRARALKHTLNWNRANNLFDPYYSLVDPAKWLHQLPLRKEDQTPKKDKRQFILEDLSNLLLYKKDTPTDSIELKVDEKKEPFISVTFGQQAMPLSRLSDGYKTMFALGADMMSVLAYLWPSPEHAEGIILIDEMGSHLHPQWKLRVVGLLRAAFPRVQFVMTTHDPLCLRGCGRNEVLVMEKQRMAGIPDSPIAQFTITATQEGLPDPAALRIDQILTSDFFGLRTTLDPELDQMLDDFIRIKQLPVASETDQTRLAEIEPKLREATLLGQTSLQRWMLDKMLTQVEAEPMQVPRLDDDLKAFLAETWEATSP